MSLNLETLSRNALKHLNLKSLVKISILNL